MTEFYVCYRDPVRRAPWRVSGPIPERATAEDGVQSLRAAYGDAYLVAVEKS